MFFPSPFENDAIPDVGRRLDRHAATLIDRGDFDLMVSRSGTDRKTTREGGWKRSQEDERTSPGFWKKRMSA